MTRLLPALLLGAFLLAAAALANGSTVTSLHCSSRLSATSAHSSEPSRLLHA
ncbi:hypothetical protein [Nocardia acidivorans]|uniref:hypothetical protein n=1 Tax=Nocardia acidivorans TaxID=404580 RepID=UPI000AB22E8B|nr:hypothetical protein [Nocardia acidivorans]